MNDKTKKLLEKYLQTLLIEDYNEYKRSLIEGETESGVETSSVVVLSDDGYGDENLQHDICRGDCDE